MKKSVAVTLLAAVTLAGWKKVVARESDRAARHGGRYIGTGIHSADGLWEHLVRKDARKKGAKGAPKNPQAATLDDDTEIIVVVNSHTGDVRRCGNYSGNCISSNPWKGQASSSPAALARHAADLEREAEADAKGERQTTARVEP